MSDKNIEQVSPDTSTYPVVITIARDFGAEGHEIGKMLSTELGIPLYDNEILVRASMRAGVTTDQIAAYDESLAAEVAAFLPDRVDTRSAADKLFKQMEGVILDLGSTQSCIIEGRLSDYILRDNPNRISVLVTAPLDARVKIVRAKRGITEKKAKMSKKAAAKAAAPWASGRSTPRRTSWSTAPALAVRAAWTSLRPHTAPRSRRSSAPSRLPSRVAKIFVSAGHLVF